MEFPPCKVIYLSFFIYPMHALVSKTFCIILGFINPYNALVVYMLQAICQIPAMSKMPRQFKKMPKHQAM